MSITYDHGVYKQYIKTTPTRTIGRRKAWLTTQN